MIREDRGLAACDLSVTAEPHVLLWLPALVDGCEIRTDTAKSTVSGGQKHNFLSPTQFLKGPIQGRRHGFENEGPGLSHISPSPSTLPSHTIIIPQRRPGSGRLLVDSPPNIKLSHRDS